MEVIEGEEWPVETEQEVPVSDENAKIDVVTSEEISQEKKIIQDEKLSKNQDDKHYIQQ